MRTRYLAALLTPALLSLGLAWAIPAFAAPVAKVETCHVPPSDGDKRCSSCVPNPGLSRDAQIASEGLSGALHR